MNTEKIKELISERKRIDDEEYWTLNEFDKKISDYLANNLEITLFFIKNECDGLDLAILSETFNLVAKKSQSYDFIEAINATAQKYPKESRDYNIFYFIENAKKNIQEK